MRQKVKTLAGYLHRIFTENQFIDKRNYLTQECDVSKILILWQILFETDIMDEELLKSRVYYYGSLLEEKDHFGRELFVCLVTLMEFIKKEQENF